MSFQQNKKIIEQKIRYDKTIVEHSCLLLQSEPSIVLFHKIRDSFTMMTGKGMEMTILAGSYTIAYYWIDRPYNVYLWRDEQGNYLGSYFNMVQHTSRTEECLRFEDLILDVLVFPDGQFCLLDEDELPEKIEQFEKGNVQKELIHLTENMESILLEVLTDMDDKFPHEKMKELLDAK
ncbi:MAG: DUF402 domain-containing protein [Bacillus sp. (in: firmicutes)]